MFFLINQISFSFRRIKDGLGEVDLQHTAISKIKKNVLNVLKISMLLIMFIKLKQSWWIKICAKFQYWKKHQNLEHFYLYLSHVMKYIHKKVSGMYINNTHIHQTKGETFIYFLISKKSQNYNCKWRWTKLPTCSWTGKWSFQWRTISTFKLFTKIYSGTLVLNAKTDQFTNIPKSKDE